MKTDPNDPSAENPGQRTQLASTDAPIQVLFGRSVDGLLGGGLSLIVIPAALAFAAFYGSLGLTGLMTAESFLYVSALVNWPHFMASFRQLYGQPDKVREHRFASLGLPIILFLVLGGFAASITVSVVPLQLATAFAAAYLPFHYTGQTFGTISCFSHLDGIRLEEVERRLVRTNLYILVAFHIMWLHRMFEPGSLPEELVAGLAFFEPLVLTLQPIGLGCGVFALFRISRRTGRALHPRVWMPWVGVHFWYVFLFFEPGALIIVQLLHAAQYLLLSSRAEFNRKELPPPGEALVGPLRPRIGRRLLYGLGLLASGLAAFVVVPELLAAFLGDTLGLTGPAEVVGVCIALFVQLNHYVTDSVVWKLRDPRVRHALFGHLAARAA